jgi:chromosome segregation ATPase
MTTAVAQEVHDNGSKATAAEDDRQVIRALLLEVRQLRLALVRANVHSVRMQTLMERVKNQQARVDRFARELTEVRMSLAEATLNRPRMLDRLKEMETRVNNESDQLLRANLDAEYKEFKFNVEQLADTAEQLRLREAELNKLQNEEMAKLSDLNAQFETMMREYEAEVVSIKP